MLELDMVEVGRVTGGVNNCWCVDDTLIDAALWQEPHVCYIVAVSAVGLMANRSTYVRWFGEKTRTECIDQCCEKTGTSNWVFGIGGGQKGNC